MNDEQVEHTSLQYCVTAPLGRPGNSDEIANKVTFLDLDESSSPREWNHQLKVDAQI